MSDDDFNMDDLELWADITDNSNRKHLITQDGEKVILNADTYAGRPVLGKILILPKSALVEFTYTKGPWACISITDSRSQFPAINGKNLVDMIRLRFDDIEYPRSVFEMFTNEQASATWDFVSRIWNMVDLLMIHCHAGISRSAAVGKAISELKQAPAFTECFDQLYTPNRHVYKTMLEQLNNEIEDAQQDILD